MKWAVQLPHKEYERRPLWPETCNLHAAIAGRISPSPLPIRRSFRNAASRHRNAAKIAARLKKPIRAAEVTVRPHPTELLSSVQVAGSRPPCPLSRAATVRSIAATAIRRARAAADAVADIFGSAGPPSRGPAQGSRLTPQPKNKKAGVRKPAQISHSLAACPNPELSSSFSAANNTHSPADARGVPSVHPARIFGARLGRAGIN